MRRNAAAGNVRLESGARTRRERASLFDLRENVPRGYPRGFCAAVACVASLFGSQHVARADEKMACAAASDSGQKLRDEGHLVKARQEFLVCARDVCPGTIKKDCADWLTQSEGSLPSVVLGAKDEHGQDLATAKVTIDGQPSDEKLEGKAMFVDPGRHTFRFEIPGEKPVDLQIVVREGEKNRAVSASWEKPADIGPQQPGGATPPPPEPASKPSHVPAYIVGGIGIAAIGVGAGFAIVGTSEYNDLKNGCGQDKSCKDTDIDPVRTKIVIADIAFGVGIVAIGTAVVLYITESGSSSAHTQVGKAGKVKFDFAPLPGGGAAMLGGSF
jgi:hypothetical protein